MNTEQLKQLWHLAFGDSPEFIQLFFDTAWSPDRCQYLEEAGQVTAALYWLDCEYAGKKYAYIYAVATHPGHRGKGLCRKLMDRTHAVLRSQGYTAALLRPADDGLRRMYRNMGYQDCTTVSEFTCNAGTAVPLRRVGPEEYARLRRLFLPPGSVLQEGVSIAYLAAYSDFYTGDGFLLAGAPYDGSFHCMELLGDRNAAPGILGALGYEHGTFRCPGREIPFGMLLPLSENTEVPGYLGLTFD